MDRGVLRDLLRAPGADLPEIVAARSRICNGFLLALALIGPLALAASLSRAAVIGWQPAMTAHVLLLLIHFAITWARHRMSYRWRAAWLVGAMVLVACIGFVNFGVPSFGSGFAVAATAMAVLMFGAIAGAAVFGFTFLFMIAVFALIMNGSIVQEIDLAALAVSPSYWLNAVASLLLIGGAVGVSTAVFSRSLIDAMATARNERNRLDALIAMAPDGILMVDAQGIIRRANARAESLFGFGPGELAGQPAGSIVAELSAAQQVARDDYRGRRRDGSPVPLSISLGRIDTLDGSLTLAMVRDMSERLRTEDQMRQMHRAEAIGRLTGGVAHEFNNILAVIGCNLELMQETAPDRPELATLAASGLKAVDQGAALTRSLLAYARRQPFRSGPVDLAALISEITPLLAGSAPGNVSVTVAVAPDLRACETEAGQLQSALLALVANALDAMPKGGVLSITAANATEPDGAFVSIAVGDTGMGMTAEVKARALEPFFTTKPIGQGTGLGLSLVDGLVRRSHGRLVIDSAPGQGTTVRLLLPRAAEAVRRAVA